MLAYKDIKTIVDWTGALFLVILLFPFLLVIVLCIKMEDSSGPVLFKQARVGKDNQVFILYKLRSMKSQTQVNGVSLSDEERLLKTGKIIRQLSLDEWPQLINILKGEMSFIGPRPLLVEYLPYYTQDEAKRHTVKPGISGWAQVNGRNNLSWKERFELDIEYVEQFNSLMDLKILFLTLTKIIKRTDVVEPGQETMMDLDEYHLKQSSRRN